MQEGRAAALPRLGHRLRGAPPGGAGLPDARGRPGAATGDRLPGLRCVYGALGLLLGAVPDGRLPPAEHLAQPAAPAGARRGASPLALRGCGRVAARHRRAAAGAGRSPAGRNGMTARVVDARHLWLSCRLAGRACAATSPGAYAMLANRR